VTDASGNSSSCQQGITLEDTTPLIVDFPLDVIITDCTQINELDAVGEPIHNGDCELVAVSMVDQVFDVVPGACYKIIRTWTVVDWCKYDPSKPVTNDGILIDFNQRIYQDDGDGYFRFTQEIKVIDNVAPTLTCPADTIVQSFSADCSANPVALSIQASDACTPQNLLKSTWTIDLFNDGNVDLNGTGLGFNLNVPLGTHRARFHVTDGCGNFSTCSFLFTVVDAKKPTPICITGLSVDLMPTTGQAMVPATAFESGDSHDNCTPHNQLQFSVERFLDLVPGQTAPGPNAGNVLVVDCDDFNSGLLTFVGLWVGDQAGNWDICITYVDVQNNMGAECDTMGTVTGTIYGKVMTEWEDEVEDVQLNLVGAGAQAMSSSAGFFNFPPMQAGGSYVVLPEKDDNALNGVSTYDILLIQKHLLGVKKFTSPYTLIAADVNNSGTVTISDIIALRKTLLSASSTFAQNNAWRFVDKSFVFTNPLNPWHNGGFPETVSIEPLSGTHKVDFVGVKIGDVSGDAQTTSLYGAEVRTLAGVLPVWTDERAVAPGEEIAVPLYLEEVHGLEGFQFTLSFDPVLEFIGYESGNIAEEHLGFRFLEDGLIAVSWNGDWKAGMEMINFHFRVREEGLLSQMLAIHSTLLRAEAYFADGGEHRFEDMALKFRNPQVGDDGLALYQNIPNPFSGHTIIGFNLPEAGQAGLLFHDVSGGLVKRIQGEYAAGFNQVEINRSHLPGPGMYYYTLQYRGRQLTRKMSLLD
jgi:hypothetical protein